MFIHEFGHFIIARRNGVFVEHFAVGFGQELFGFTDKKGTRWGFHLVPLGGYVRMLGDADASSATADKETISKLTEEQKNQTLHSKTPWQRIKVAFGGPLANFIFAIVGMFFLFAFVGRPIVPPVVDSVAADSLAEKHGLQSGDRIQAFNGAKINDFMAIKEFLSKTTDHSLQVEVLRDDKVITLNIPLTATNLDGAEPQRVKVLGVRPRGQEYQKIPILEAFSTAVIMFFEMVIQIFHGLWEMVTGNRSASELGGILAIGDMAAQSAKLGMAASLWFMIIISINLGVINLFPIPVLDGGQIVITAVEWVKGTALSETAQKIIFGSGFAMVICLMLYSTWNDLMRFHVIQKIQHFIGI